MLNVQLPFIMMTLQRPNLHRRGGYKRGVPTADVVSISNMALKFKLGKECLALSAALTILSRACLQQTRGTAVHANQKLFYRV